jgi:tRNA dimethylallyltransferase
MIEEVKQLLENGVPIKMLHYYGLEYRFVSQYINGEISYNQLFKLLNTAIHQFAKRQMTWFRHMEKNGTVIHWIDGHKPENEKIDLILSMYNHPEFNDRKD